MKYEPSNVLVSVNDVEQNYSGSEEVKISEQQVVNLTIKLKPEIRTINISIQSTDD